VKGLESFSTRDAMSELIDRLPSREAIGRTVGLAPAPRSSTAANLALVASGMLLGAGLTLLFAPALARELGLRGGSSPRGDVDGDPSAPGDRPLTEM
jgi:hypothetical protein